MRVLGAPCYEIYKFPEIEKIKNFSGNLGDSSQQKPIRQKKDLHTLKPRYRLKPSRIAPKA